MKNIFCLRCNSPMNFIETEKIQLGQTGWILGSLSNLVSGALEVDIYSCPECGKIELFQTEIENTKSNIAQTICPKCGKHHDIDYPKCPFCKYEY